MRQQLIKGVGGRLFVEWPSRPSAVVVTIKRASGSDLEGGAVVAAAATADPLHLIQDQDVADAADVEGRSIVATLQNDTTPEIDCPVEIVKPDGSVQFNSVSAWHWIDEDNLSAVVSFRHAWRFDPPAPQGTSVRSLRSWYTIPAESCQIIEENFRAVFTAMIGGQPVVKEVLYDVGLRDSSNPAGVHDILSEWGDLRYSESAEWAAESGWQAIQGGWQDLQVKIRARRLNPHRIRDVEPLKSLIVNRAMRRLAIVGSVPPAWVADVAGFIEFLDESFKTAFADVLAGLQWYDNEDTGQTGIASDTAPNFNRIRLTR